MKEKEKKRIIKKIFILMLVMCICLVSVNFKDFLTVFAEGEPIVQINNSSEVSGNFFIYKDQSGTQIGKIGIRLNYSNTYLPISGNTVVLPTSTINDMVIVDLIPESGYEVGGTMFVSGSSVNLPGAESNGVRSYGLEIESAGQISIIDNVLFNVIGEDNPNPPAPQGGNAHVQVNGSASLSGNYFVFKGPNQEVIGKVGVRLSQSNEYLPISGNQVSLTESAVGTRITVDIIPESGYEVSNNVMVDGHPANLPGAEANGMRSLGIDITSAGQVVNVDVGFQVIGSEENQPNPPVPGPGIDNYDIVAYFDGVQQPVKSNDNGDILMPNGWTHGNVTFFARTCTVNGEMKPYYDGMECDENSYHEERMDIEGTANLDQINRTAYNAGQRGDMKGVITNDFSKYGKVTYHLMTQGINKIVSVTSSDLIFIKAYADIEMSYSLGTADVDNAILTNSNSGKVSIFFGNTAVYLVAYGENVQKISKVVGGTNVEYNAQEGGASVSLPSLSKETTTRLTVTIDLKDGTKVTKIVDVARTAVTLSYNNANGNGTLQAGYVFNKGYLYNNKNHDDKVFNAYLQVILYKDGVVAGYKQLKIDDEDAVNRLHENESGSIELHGDDCINLYGVELNDTIEGVNSASVFLTNGPVDFNSDTLPSIEFGIGSGVTIEWGNN